MPFAVILSGGVVAVRDIMMVCTGKVESAREARFAPSRLTFVRIICACRLRAKSNTGRAIATSSGISNAISTATAPRDARRPLVNDLVLISEALVAHRRRDADA